MWGGGRYSSSVSTCVLSTLSCMDRLWSRLGIYGFWRHLDGYISTQGIILSIPRRSVVLLSLAHERPQRPVFTPRYDQQQLVKSLVT